MRAKTAWHIETARTLRRAKTKPERLLWSVLRPQRCPWPIFRSQHPFGDRFIVDFVCLEAKLIVEVDGQIHELKEESDASRQRFLEMEGYEVLRISAATVLRDYQEMGIMLINHARSKLGKEPIDPW